jgi:hypothetical protein
MENGRDSSVWRSLAVAFGDGLAFSVGMALAQKARREAPAQAALQSENSAIPVDRIAELERRLAQLERTPARIDPKVLETIVGAFENDLRARDEEWTRRLDVAVEPARQAVSRKEHAELIEALRHGIAEAVPRIVHERVSALLNTRLGDIEARLREEAQQAAVIAAEGALRTQLAEREREISELREELAASHRRTADLLSAIGDACKRAAEPVAEQAAEPEAPKAEAAGEEGPRFPTEPPRVWSLPLVSSLLVASGCFAAMHWF